MKKLFIILIFMISLSLNFISCSEDLSSKPEQESDLAEQLQAALDNGLLTYQGKGLAAVVILPDGEIWSGTSGISHENVKITADMPFAAGSITKCFTAAIILQLAEEGEISLSDSLCDWVPALPYVDSTISIRQLLNHTSGLFDIADNPDFWESVFQDPSRTWTPAEMISTFNREPLFPKGTGWNYSSTGYALLRKIIIDITGSELPVVYRDRIFVPLKMNNTFASMGEPLPENTAHGWWDLDMDGSYDDFYYWPRTAFASGIGGEIFSTAVDLAKWAKALLKDRNVLSESTMNEMLTFHSPCTGEEAIAAAYGLGVARFNPEMFSNLEVIGHSGNAPGYAAACLYLPDYEVCIGFMDNTEEGNAMYTINDLITVIINHYE